MAEPVRPSSRITVGKTVETPQPPMAWQIQIRVKVMVVGFLNSPLTCPKSQVFAFDDGCVLGRLSRMILRSLSVSHLEVSG